MIVKLLTEYPLEFLSLKADAEACPSLHLSKCQIVGHLMPRLIIKSGYHYYYLNTITDHSTAHSKLRKIY